MTEVKKPKRAYRGGGRKRTGVLILTRSGYSAKYWTTVDGEKTRVTRALGTDNKAVAKRKLARLLESEAPTPSEPVRVETFEEAARGIVERQAKDGLGSWKDRLRRLEQCAFPEFGPVAVTGIRPGHVREALERAAERGWLRQSIVHLKNDVSSILAELWREEVIPENPALRVQVPKNAKVDARTRVILTDEEFDRFMACRDVSAELAVMALVSRTFGGMRTSDLHAWDWAHVDRKGWLDAHVPRPKTKSSSRMVMPDLLVPMLKAWWERAGKPTSGAVFPAQRGKRAGLRKQGKISYAKALRGALWAAGVVRPLEGFELARAAWQSLVSEETARNAEAKAAKKPRPWTERQAAIARTAEAEEKARACCLIQSGSAELKPLDFHSFRRAFNTALADVGLNIQTAMRLAGHKNAATHMRYVMIAETLTTPTGAMPKLSKAPALPALRQSAEKTVATVLEPKTLCFLSAPRWVRTTDLRLRRPSLYPAELGAREGGV